MLAVVAQKVAYKTADMAQRKVCEPVVAQLLMALSERTGNFSIYDSGRHNHNNF